MPLKISQTRKKNTPAKATPKSARPKTTCVVTKDMLIGDVVQKCPESASIMFKYGLHCLGCGMVAYESLEQGSQAHGLSEKEIEQMVKEINGKLKK